MNNIYILLIFLFFVVVYILQDKGIIPPITETPPATETPSLVSSQQPDGCVGTWTDVGTCNIDRCDPRNIGRGLGKQKQDFVVEKSSENGATSCNGYTREVGCSIDDYTECYQCGETWTDVTSCPSRTDYSIPDEQFYKTQRKITTKMTPGIKCEERRLRCPRDCSGSFVYSECDASCNIVIDGQVIKNTTGLVTGEITNTFNVFKTKLYGEDDNQNTIFDTRGNCPTSDSTRCDLLCDVDCQGEYRDIETCQINGCDPSNNFVGLGTKRQLFEITIDRQNEGIRCPPRERIVDCSSNLHDKCVKCPGEFVIGATCKNVTSCNGSTGNGQREDVYVVTANTALSNCVAPGTRFVDCSLNNAPNCTCSYTYDPPTFADCRENQIICSNDGSPICTRDFTQTNALSGGVCPTPDRVGESTNLNHNHSCTCIVDRTFEPWSFAFERCGGTNNLTPIGTRTRIITVRKKTGYTACKFPKISPSETILDTPENNAKGGVDQDNRLFFKGTNDTFQTVEIEANFNSTDQNEIDKCVCEGPWTNVTSCPSRTDYSIPDNQFYKTQSRTTTKTTPGIICEERQIKCPRDCSGSFVYSACADTFGIDISCNTIIEGQVIKNTSGSVTGTITNTFNVFKTKLDGEDDNQNPIVNSSGECPKNGSTNCGLLCDVDCEGEFRDIEICQINKCDPNNNFVGVGTKRQSFNKTQDRHHEGRYCPGDKTVDCSFNNHGACMICACGFVTGATCSNITSCNGSTGNGKREDIYLTNSTALPNCVAPGTRFADCSLNNAPNCTCSYTYDAPTFADCNLNQIVCNNDSKPICTRTATQTNALSGGVCPAADLVGETPNINPNHSCSCTVDRTIDPWTFTFERCGGTNNRTPIGTRTRPITVKKTSGYTACKFPKLSPSETIKNTPENNAKGGVDPYSRLFFKGTYDTFQTFETEANFSSTDQNEIDKCVCEGAWIDISSCPSRTDYRTAIDKFKKTQRKTTTKTSSGITCEVREISCPRDCLGGDVDSNSSFSEWGQWTTNCPAADDKTSPVSAYRIPLRSRTRTYIKLADDFGGGECPGIQEKYTKQIQTDVACPRNCIGGDVTLDSSFTAWGGWSRECPSATDRNANDADFNISSRSKTREYIKTPGFNGGVCPGDAPGYTTQTQTNIQCNRDCLGDWSAWGSCDCIGLRYRYFTLLPNKGKINNGADCPYSPDLTSSGCPGYSCSSIPSFGPMPAIGWG